MMSYTLGLLESLTNDRPLAQADAPRLRTLAATLNRMADTLDPPPADEPANIFTNGDFAVLDRGRMFETQNGVGVYLIGDKLWHGPGDSAATKVSFIDELGERFLRIEYIAPPQRGEDQYQPGFRFTMLERHHLEGGLDLLGKRIAFSFWCRVAGEGMWLIPIMWVNYVNGDYQIFHGTLTIDNNGGRDWYWPKTTWEKVSGTFDLPPMPPGKVTDSSRYVGFGIDFPGKYAPTIDFADFRMHVV